ncbi:MAG: type III-B CRISPR module-associated protein Cmr5 [Micromonosporaceae bacterium]|nr:type III-B CRISPR module-associated protein Cmr5 [Micromonosporaceae bacterium]
MSTAGHAGQGTAGHATMRRLDQGMALAAAEILPASISRDLRTRYRQLPIMVRMSGLAATTAYLVSKSGKPGGRNELETAYHDLATGIRKRLTAGYDLGWGGREQTNEALVARLAELPASEYARASVEVQALATWLSRLAEARYKAQPAAPSPSGSAGTS